MKDTESTLLIKQHTPNYVSRKWERNSSTLEKFQKAGFSIFYDEPRKCFIRRIDQAPIWSNDFGYEIKQLTSDEEAIMLAREKFHLPVTNDGFICDFKIRQK